MIFLEDLLRILFYTFLILILFLVGYISYDVYFADKLHTFIENSKHLSFFIKLIKSIDKIGWVKIGIIVLSPIVSTYLIITTQTAHFRKRKRFVDYTSRIKGWWKE